MNDETITLSVVTFNNEDKVEKIIKNIVNVFTGNINYKVFFVDNCSTDNTVNNIKRSMDRNENIKLIESHGNIGFGAGHNTVIKFIHSTYHLIVNPDIEIPDFQEIAKMINFMDNNEQYGLLSPLILNDDKTIQKLYKREPTVFDLFIRFVSPNLFKKRQMWFVRSDSGYNKIGSIEYASGSFMFFRTDIFKKIGGFDSRYFMYMEDADITRKINSVSKAVFFPEACVVHEWQRESHKKIKFIFYSISSLFKYFNKWGWKTI